MQVSISKKEYDFLKNHLCKYSHELYSKLRIANIENITIKLENIDEDSIDDIREWAIEYNLEIGFDDNYNANEEGKILNSIIDKFYF
jgi:hypothetical protein